MNEALCSILSGEDEWCYDSSGRSITFNKDGTGQLLCHREHGCWIATDFEWKSTQRHDRVETPDKAVKIARSGPRLLRQLDLEITLGKKMPEWVRNSFLSGIVNEHILTDEAFQPKLYTIRIEKGNFIEPCCIGWSNYYTPGVTMIPPSRFALRIVFDKSPYPPRCEWKRAEGGPDSYEFWNHKEFVARRSPELEKQGRAMNDIPPAWNTCIVS